MNQHNVLTLEYKWKKGNRYVKIEFHVIKSLITKNDSERRPMA